MTPGGGGPPLVNLITRDNGVGLSTDLALLREICTTAGYDTTFVPWEARSMRPCHVGVFLELWNPRLVPYCAQTVGVFNLEWFPARWRLALSRTGRLWAKSREAHDLYRGWSLRSVHTGFVSRDLFDPGVERAVSCLHLKGHSDLKGTQTVLQAWDRHGAGLPPLTIVSARPIPYPPPGVTVLGRQEPAELVRLMNAHTIHLCPSQSEGWGHYIVEGMLCGAVVITTDASPMNEHIQSGRGFLLPAVDGPPHHMVPTHLTDPDDLAAAVLAAAALDPAARERMGAAARTAALDRNAAFTRTARNELAALTTTTRRH